MMESWETRCYWSSDSWRFLKKKMMVKYEASRWRNTKYFKRFIKAQKALKKLKTAKNLMLFQKLNSRLKNDFHWNIKAVFKTDFFTFCYLERAKT